LGYLAGVGLFLVALIVLVAAQIRASAVPPCTGRRLLPQPPLVLPWLISPTAHLGSAIRVARRCCLFASLRRWGFGIGLKTRPLGATIGDFLDKPLHDGGLALSRPFASAALAVFIIVCLLSFRQRPGRHPTKGKNQRQGADHHDPVDYWHIDLAVFLIRPADELATGFFGGAVASLSLPLDRQRCIIRSMLPIAAAAAGVGHHGAHQFRLRMW
jgi:hypothetical protein